MTESRDPRDEAERLIASVLGSASVAAEGLRGFATGSAECCVCPVCKAIAAARDPSPQVAERLASGAGDLAAGLAAMLRSFSRAGTGGPGESAGSTPPGASGGEDPWRTATRAAAEKPAGPSAAAPAATGPSAAAPAASAPAPGAAEPAAPPVPPKPMAKKATKPKAPPAEPGEE